MQPRLGVFVLAIFALLVAGSPAFAPPPPPGATLSAYAAPHLFALPGATTTRLFGMGGFITCVKDAGFANPAYAGTLATHYGVGRHSLTDFDGGLDLEGMQWSLAWPLRPDETGLQVTYFDLDSKRGSINFGGQSLLATFKEQDLALHYGHRLSEMWIVGLSVGPKMDTESDIYNPLPLVPLLHLESEADIGFRLGTLYQMAETGWVGFVYDRYDEDVSGSGSLLGGSASGSFKSEEIALGVSRQVSDKVLAAIEWQQMTTEGMGQKIGESGMRFGAEVQVDEDWTLRGGWNDGAVSLGAGWTEQDWSLQYAYINDWNDDAVGASLGGSSTHQLGLRYQW